MSAQTSRRAVILGLAGTAAFAGTIGAAVAAPAGQAPDPYVDPPGSDHPSYDIGRHYGEEQGRKLMLFHMARAWIDRWHAAGGDFGLMFDTNGNPKCIMHGKLEPSFWTPTDPEKSDLAPHMHLREEGDQSGAVRVLEAMLVLVPGLRETIHDCVGPELIAFPIREA